MAKKKFKKLGKSFDVLMLQQFIRQDNKSNSNLNNVHVYTVETIKK